MHTYQNHNPFFFPARQQKKLKIRQLNMAIEVFRNFEVSNNSTFEICNTSIRNVAGNPPVTVQQLQQLLPQMQGEIAQLK